MSEKDKVRRPPTIASRPEDLVQQVRERYAKIAEGTLSGCSGAGGSCCGPVESAVAVGIGYAEQDLSASPDGSNLGLGCGAPITHLELRPGETVLDLGSGPGLDCFLAARAVGPQGRVIGVDMTPEMVGRARANAERAGLGTVEFRLGRLEALPVQDASVDAVTSNCVINLVPDKAAVFREVARVLKPGGRLVVSDIVLERSLPEAVSRDLLAYVGCIAGAMLRDRYFTLLRASGLEGPTVFKDVDYLEAASYALPADLLEGLRSQGIETEDLRGVVRSVTYGARRPEAS